MTTRSLVVFLLALSALPTACAAPAPSLSEPPPSGRVVAQQATKAAKIADRDDLVLYSTSQTAGPSASHLDADKPHEPSPSLAQPTSQAPSPSPDPDPDPVDTDDEEDDRGAVGPAQQDDAFLEESPPLEDPPLP